MGSLSNLYISQSYQSLIHIGTNNTASAALIGLQDGLGNNIGVAVNTAGDLFLSGSLTASLQQGYLYVGNASGKTTAFATSSLVTTVDTGSLVTTASFNAFTQSINSATQSLFTSASLALVTASFDNNTRNLTFTKGNTTQFSVNIPDVSGSTINTGSFATTSSFNSYTQSTNIRLNNLETTSASVNVSISNLNSTTSSFATSIANLNSNSASVNTSITNLNVSSASQQVSINALNTFTASQSTASIVTSITNLNQATSSLFGSASLALVTASFDNGTRNLTFTKGDASTFNVNIPDVSGSTINTGSFATTGSNSFNGNQTTTGSVIINYSPGNNPQLVIDSNTNEVTLRKSAGVNPLLIESTAGGVNINSNETYIGDSANIFYPNASSNQNTLKTTNITGTFTASLQEGYAWVGGVGNVSKLVATSSFGSTIDTGSYATTGSNNFIGNQTITGNISAFSASFTYLQTIFESSSIIYSSGSNQFGDELSDVQTLSGSVKVQGSLTVNGTPVLTSSVDISGLVTTSSFNAYTQSNDQRVSSLETNSASVNISITNVNSATASLFTSVNNINTFTQSAQISINALNAATSSYVTSAITASSLVTASFDNGTRNLTFTKGDATTFNVNIPDVSGSSGNFVTTSSFNSYTASTDSSISQLNASSASQQVSIDALNTNSASVNVSISNINSTTASLNTSVSNINTFTQSANISINALNAATSSYATSAITASSLITASVSLNTITFTKGDGTTFPITVNTGSGGGGSTDTGSLMVTGSIAGNILTFTKGDASQFSLTIPSATGSVFDTGSFATTGSNTFNGIETINIPTGSAGEGIRLFNTGSDASGSMRFGITDPGNPFIKLKNKTWFQFGTNDELQFESFTSSYDNGIVIGPYYTGSQKVRLVPRSSSLQFTQDVGSGELPILTLGVPQGIGSEQPSIFNTPLVINQTFTASLANGFTYVGNSSNISTLVATSSFGSSINTGSLMRTGSVSGNVLTFTKGDATTFSLTVATGSTINTGSFATTGSNSFRGVENIGDISGTGQGEVYLLGRSGSLIIGNSTATPTYAALAHLSSSQINANTNLIFKPNSNTGDTIISGSSNIFTNPATPTAGYKRYIGGSNNLYLNNSNGINSQITASATSVSGARPSMVNNIFNGTGNFSINQATNPGTHTYGQNIITGTGTTTINALGFTGSLNFNSNFNNNGTITINAASASVTEIATGISGSGTVTVQNNGIFGGTITNTSPRTLLTTNTQTVSANILAGGSITLTNISSSAAVSVQNNIGGGGFTYSNAGAAGLGLHTTAGSMTTNIGAMTLIASASAITAANNISPAAMTVTNRMYSGSLGVGSMQFNNNQTQGASNTYTVSGSFGGTGTGAIMQANGIFGASNTLFTNVEGRGNYVDVRNNLIGGTFLILTGSNNLFTTGSGGGYFGRFNANDGLRNGTAENILVVGTGTSADNRKTGFLIDSGSNSYFEGSLNVSGSTSLTGSLTTFGNVTLTNGNLELLGIASYIKANNITGSWGQTNGTAALQLNGGLDVNGNVKVASTFQLNLPTGSNQQAGTAVLDGANPGAVVVSNSLVTANSIIMVSKQTLNHPNGYVAVSSKGSGTFTITSNHNGDTDTVGWFIINNS